MREMKDSGIAWIGEIPKEWEVGTVGVFFDEINNPNYNQEETNTLQFKMGDIISKKNGDSKYNPETIAAYNVVEPGAIMINGLNLSFDLVSQRVAQVHEKGAITSTYLAMMPKNGLQSDYAKYMLKAYDNCKVLHSMGRGLRATLSYNTFRTEPIFKPSIQEQQSIANFLDEKCGEIDELVALQEKMIDELKAYKQSVITETVTKGLNPNAKMKDSGVDWIGEIPEHWSTPKLSHLTSKIGSGSTPHGGSEIYVNQGVKFLRSQNILNEGLFLDDVAYITEDIDNEMSGTRVQVDDILFNITGGSIGRCYYVEESLGKANVNQHVCIVRPNGVSTKYLLYYLQSEKGQHQVRIRQTGGNREGLSAAAFKEFVITLPPKEEQHQIATYLDEKCSEIDSLISIKQKKIEELKDYKKSLIYEYVTGKKQVE